MDFHNSVAFNFTGAGFVTEIGDELGTFDKNMEIQGQGNGELRLGFKMNSRLPVINGGKMSRVRFYNINGKKVLQITDKA
ncbi:hypothetical protein ACWGOQ_0012745 [Aquimarina sp. M1]